MSSLFQFRVGYGFRLESDWVSLTFAPGRGPQASLRVRGGHADVLLPAGFDFSRPAAQAWANRVVVALLRRRAQEVLPARLDAQARRHGLRYRRVVVKNVRSRWGSCSADGNINLSLWLMLLPVRFVDYVIAHELAHLDEMNHGPRFWAVADRLLGSPGAARAAERDLRAYCRTRWGTPAAGAAAGGGQ